MANTFEKARFFSANIDFSSLSTLFTPSLNRNLRLSIHYQGQLSFVSRETNEREERKKGEEKNTFNCLYSLHHNNRAVKKRRFSRRRMKMRRLKRVGDQEVFQKSIKLLILKDIAIHFTLFLRVI